MTKLSLILLASCVLSTEAAPAPNSPEKTKPAAASPAAPKPSAAAKAKTPEPEATPAPKKRGLMGRVFGKKETPEATPPATPPATPAPQAAPAPRTGRKSRPADDSQESPAARSKKADPEKAAAQKAQATEPSPEKAANAQPATTKGKKGAKTPVAAVKKPGNEPPVTTDPEVLEKWKLSEAKTKALEDPELRAIKSKADAAVSDEESRKTLRIYNKALFSKIREIDPSIKERADRMEVAILKQLSETE
ncbi:MAG: hypothetical protein JWL90_1201 [Chthoniobacteraceae bacterium]|nr:hypothetical protein [Chthoniobacteraceae bacterium]